MGSMSPASTLSCPDCPYEGTKRSAFARHSCERQRSVAASRARGQARREQVDREPKKCTHAHHHPHGTLGAYKMDGCRCDPCSEHYRTSKSSWRRQYRESGRQGYHDAAVVREHLERLRRRASLQDLVDQSGLSNEAISSIMSGKRRWVQDLTARTILSLRPVSVAPGGRLPSVGARRRLQALVLRGWDPQTLATELGHTTTLPVLRVLRGEQDRITATKHRAIQDLVRRLDARQAPPGRRGRGAWSRERYQAWARDQGWMPLAAWDDVDDPHETPKGVAKEATLRPWERREEVIFLAEQGRGPDEIAPLLGVSAGYVADLLRAS